MAQLSRPYQIALVAIAFLALVWFVALRGHSSSSGSTPVASAPASTPAPTAAGEAKAAAAPTRIYHGAAPGVEGLTRAINHAHGAVAASQGEAHRFENESAQAPGQSGADGNASTAGSKQAAVPARTAGDSSKNTTAAKTSTGAAGTPRTATGSGIPAKQATVEGELKQGKVVLVLFWNPKGADDVAVRKELQAVGKQLGGKIAVHDALASEVGSFGSVTRAIQVYETPTILFVNGKGLTTTLTGFTDAFSIEQTIDEARQA